MIHKNGKRTNSVICSENVKMFVARCNQDEFLTYLNVFSSYVHTLLWRCDKMIVCKCLISITFFFGIYLNLGCEMRVAKEWLKSKRKKNNENLFKLSCYWIFKSRILISTRLHYLLKASWIADIRFNGDCLLVIYQKKSCWWYFLNLDESSVHVPR